MTVPTKVLSGNRVVLWATWAVGALALASGVCVAIALYKRAALSDAWLFELSVFVAVATAPQFVIDLSAQAAEAVAEDDLPARTITRGFNNLGAWVGVIERPLLLGSLIGGFPVFIGGWYVLKGIAGYQLGLSRKELKERRAFQLFLINNGMSFAGVALGWLIWKLLRFPV